MQPSGEKVIFALALDFPLPKNRTIGMPTQIVMPKLSPTMEEGQLSKWLKKEGDQVSMGEPLAEIETDKASMEMQALGTGVLRKILINEGATVPLGQVIGIIGEADEDISALVGQAESVQAGAEDKKYTEEKAEGDGDAATTAAAAPQTKPPTPAAASPAPSTGNGQQAGGAATAGQRQLVSPLAARMAAEAGIKLNTLDRQWASR
ncbi:MAG: biotin/lipoyl-containing protein [Pyrinomonadaceae bacterium]